MNSYLLYQWKYIKIMASNKYQKTIKSTPTWNWIPAIFPIFTIGVEKY